MDRKIKVYPIKITYMYLIANYLIYYGGMICLSMAFGLYFAKGDNYSADTVAAASVLGILGIVVGGKVVHMKKFFISNDKVEGDTE